MPSVRKPKREVGTEEKTYGGFNEGDVVVPKAGVNFDQDLAILLAGDDETLVLCFCNRRVGALDLTGILAVYLADFFRPATADERARVLSRMEGKVFGTHRGPDYFTRWWPKLETVVFPTLARLKKEAETPSERG